MQTLLACCAIVASLSFAVSAGCAVDLLLARRRARRVAGDLERRVTAARAAAQELVRREADAPARRRSAGHPYRLDSAPRT